MVTPNLRRRSRQVVERRRTANNAFVKGRKPCLHHDR